MAVKTKTEQGKITLGKNQMIVVALVSLAVLAAAYMGTNQPANAEQIQTTTSTTLAKDVVVEKPAQQQDSQVKVEVYHFHATNQCWSCKTLGELAEKTVNTYFKNELDSGKLKFGHINIQLAQNAELTNKYGATGSSLMIGVYKDGKFTKEEDTKVWYKLNNEEDYLSYLKGILDKRLKGDLS